MEAEKRELSKAASERFAQSFFETVRLAVQYCEENSITAEDIRNNPLCAKYNLEAYSEEIKAAQVEPEWQCEDPEHHKQLTELITADTVRSILIRYVFAFYCNQFDSEIQAIGEEIGQERHEELVKAAAEANDINRKYPDDAELDELLAQATNAATDKMVGVFNELFKVKAMKEREGGFYNIPSSAVTQLALMALGSGETFKELPARTKKISKSKTTMKVAHEDGMRKVVQQNPSGTITISMNHIEGALARNSAAKKLFRYILVTMNASAIHGGELSRPSVGFSLKELTEAGIYNSSPGARDTYGYARKAFQRDASILATIQVAGEIRKGKKKEAQADMAVLFTGYNIKNNYCTVYLNDRVNWSIVAQYYTILPRWALKLSNRGCDLVCYVFYLARQNCKDIREHGYFTINLRAIQRELALPSEAGNEHPTKTIKREIEKAVEEAEAQTVPSDITFTLCYDEDASIKEYLDNGYLKVEMKGSYAQNFIAQAERQEAKIKEYQAKMARISEKAHAAALTKKIEGSKKKPKS